MGRNLLFLRELRLKEHAVKLKLCNHKALWLCKSKSFKQAITKQLCS